MWIHASHSPKDLAWTWVRCESLVWTWVCAQVPLLKDLAWTLPKAGLVISVCVYQDVCIVIYYVLLLCNVHSNQPSYPTQRACQLREDIIALVRFWQNMHSDKKYLRTTDVTIGGRLHLVVRRHMHDANLVLVQALVPGTPTYARLCLCNKYWRYRKDQYRGVVIYLGLK